MKVRTRNQILWKEVLEKGIKFETRILETELPRANPTVIRCYNCQALASHISSECTSPTVCNRCSGPHQERQCTATELKCANCQKSHCASDSKCEIWKQKFEKAKLEQTSATKLDIVNVNSKIKEIDSKLVKSHEYSVRATESINNTIVKKCGEISTNIETQMDQLFDLLGNQEPRPALSRKRMREELRQETAAASSPEEPETLLPPSQNTSASSQSTPVKHSIPAPVKSRISTPTKLQHKSELSVPKQAEAAPTGENAEASSSKPTSTNPTVMNPTSNTDDDAVPKSIPDAEPNNLSIRCCEISNPDVFNSADHFLPCCMDGFCQIIENELLTKVQNGMNEAEAYTTTSRDGLWDMCKSTPIFNLYQRKTSRDNIESRLKKFWECCAFHKVENRIIGRLFYDLSNQTFATKEKEDAAFSYYFGRFKPGTNTRKEMHTRDAERWKDMGKILKDITFKTIQTAEELEERRRRRKTSAMTDWTLLKNLPGKRK